MAVERKSMYLCLLPFCILIPLGLRVAYYRMVVAKISAYIIIHYEQGSNILKWETRNMEATSNPEKLLNFITLSRYYEFIILAVASYILYIVLYFEKTNDDILRLVWPVIGIVIMIPITIIINSMDKMRRKWIIIWSNQRNFEKIRISSLKEPLLSNKLILHNE